MGNQPLYIARISKFDGENRIQTIQVCHDHEQSCSKQKGRWWILNTTASVNASTWEHLISTIEPDIQEIPSKTWRQFRSIDEMKRSGSLLSVNMIEAGI